MTPLALRLKNFRSFSKEQHFRFPAQPGLYFMQGLNEVEPRLGGNACGKTTIWEALTWCLYGVTADGLKAGDVCNWHASGGAEVAFAFLAADGEPCRITRTWGPNSWTLERSDDFDEETSKAHRIDLTKDSSNPVLSMLRLELEPWLNCVLTAQGRPMFLDLKQEAQAQLFSEVLGLDRWVQYSERASKKAKAQDAVSRELEARVARIRGELEALTSQDLSKGHDDWELENAKRILRIQADHEDGLKRRKRLKAEYLDAEEAERAARAVLKEAQPDPELAARLKEKEREVRRLEDELLQEEQKRRALESHERALNEQGVCPTCGKGLSRAEREEEFGKVERAAEAVGKMIKRLKDLVATSRLEADRMGASLDKELGALRRAQGAVEDASREVSSARRALELQDRELDRLEEQAEELSRQENPFAKMAQNARKRAQTLREELGEAQDSLDASNARYGLLSYWVRGFKEVRLQLIAEALTELEIEVNSAVTALGLVDWELKFAVDRAGKGGGIQRGFSVLVKSPHNPEPTPWKAWSGGEKQRLRLAANMGLADLIRSRTGAPINLEVWDEPTNGLSPEGWTDLLESLAARAQAEQRVVFITDHKAHDFGGFAGTATVIKRPSGSKVECSWSRV